MKEILDGKIYDIDKVKEIERTEKDIQFMKNFFDKSIILEGKYLDEFEKVKNRNNGRNSFSILHVLDPIALLKVMKMKEPNHQEREYSFRDWIIYNQIIAKMTISLQNEQKELRGLKKFMLIDIQNEVLSMNRAGKTEEFIADYHEEIFKTIREHFPEFRTLTNIDIVIKVKEGQILDFCKLTDMTSQLFEERGN